MVGRLPVGRQTASMANPASTPRQRLVVEAERRGERQLVRDCVRLLSGRDVDPELIFVLGGAPARWAVHGGEPGPDYWLRVWALRGLLWVWDDTAIPAVLRALSDEAWRVREAALKVVRRHHLETALPTVLKLRADPTARVSHIADRTIAALTGSNER